MRLVAKISHFRLSALAGFDYGTWDLNADDDRRLAESLFSPGPRI